MPTEIPLPNENDQPGYYFPGYIPRFSKNRVLALLDGNLIVTEDGQLFNVPSLEQIHYWAFSYDLLIFVESILGLPWLEQAQGAYGAIIFATPAGIPTALQLHGKKGGHHCTRWLICSASWQQFTPTTALLHRLRMLFEHCEVGTANTPASLGMALQKKAFYAEYGDTWYEHKHPLPPLRCVEDLRSMSTGARSDLLAPQTAVFERVYELDMKNGYAAAFVEQPTGATIPHQGRFLEQYTTYVANCTVTITEPLILGCFPVRKQQGKQTILEYPGEPGTYETFLWKEEIDLIREKGCIVECGPGWGWLEMTQDNRRWVQLMTHLRDTAPEEIADWIKLAIVGSIGRHGCPWQSTFLVPEGEQSEGDVEASWDGLAYDWYIHQAMLHIPESMQHWFSYTLMKCRLELYRYALPYAQKGQLLATNTDGIFVSGDADVSSVVQKDEAGGQPAGTWRASTLTNVSFPALRHLVSDQKKKRPGVSRNTKR